jgi:outer membrane receptor protein involved in Fe transport
VTVGADGPLATLAAGMVRAAIGGEYRHEAFAFSAIYPTQLAYVANTRDLKAIFSELNIPILPGAGTQNIGHLDVNISGRFEEYSDVGSKAVPKIGFTALLSEGLKLYGTWSKAFRAPTLSDLHYPDTIYIIPVPDPKASSGSSLALYANGGNAALRPETANSTSVGIDFNPKAISGLSLSLTAYDINYTNRIAGLSNPNIALTDPTNAVFVTRNPSAIEQQSVIVGATGGVKNYSGLPYDPSTISALINGERANIFSQDVYGADLMARYRRHVEFGTAEVFLNLAYLEFRQQNTAIAPQVEVAGRLKGRGGVSFDSGSWTTSVAVNWMDSSIDTFDPAQAKVSSWTTVDAHLSYDLSGRGILSGIRILVSIQNLFDQNPPYVPSASSVLAGLSYDSVNATPLGRFGSLKITKSW